MCRKNKKRIIVSVVVPTVDPCLRLPNTVAALSKQTIDVDVYEIIVVINSNDRNAKLQCDAIASQYKNMRVVVESTIGRSFARNCGIRKSSGDLIVLMDDDIEVAPNHLESHLLHHANRGEGVAVIGRVVDVSAIRPWWLRNYFQARECGGSVSRDRREHVLPGHTFATGNVSIRRAALDRVSFRVEGEMQYFDPKFSFREDADLGFRLTRQGTTFVHADDIICKHDHPRGASGIAKRAYYAGYALPRLFRKYPECEGSERYLSASALTNVLLLFGFVVSFVPALAVGRVAPRLMYKVIGAGLAFFRNIGYARALHKESSVSRE